ncbi:type II toxin-antitoxin system HicB family antitoxin [Nodosilinea sp. LEGE 07088]|uniref:type II toxin-antitoxin system HicB family antitoxin n=1 Tax=Nodosilinea sp. LEGE 07088 TaxID=2777968 RepID=UPI00188254CD|nr:type II toxin-antitoxin system HicB family antitoxin [Nodosilinea sp. LEGE 07088]MBE9137654.1 type II toxin-antitoxin system HicB family antitoxin [Nodosilinea sp. LEGE 07088]
MSNLRYEMIIVWSEEEDCFLVHLPDFPEQTYRTHGSSYEEAVRNGREVLQLLLEEDGLPLPEPKFSVAQ